MSALVYVLCFVVTVRCCEAARILAVFPVPSISHQVVFRPLTHELAKRGHEVTVITTDPAFSKGATPGNLTEIDVHDISYNLWRDQFMLPTHKGSKNDLHHQISAILETVISLVEHQLRDAEVQKLINDKTQKFDLLLLEGCIKAALIYSYIYKGVPVIQVSSLGAVIGNYEAMGAPTHPFLYPLLTRQRITNLTVWEKITELYGHYRMERIYANANGLIDGMFRKNFGPDVTPVAKLVENVDMLFLNVHPVFEGIRPVPPSVIYMGGLHQNPEKDLPTVSITYALEIFR